MAVPPGVQVEIAVTAAIDPATMEGGKQAVFYTPTSRYISRYPYVDYVIGGSILNASVTPPKTRTFTGVVTSTVELGEPVRYLTDHPGKRRRATLTARLNGVPLGSCAVIDRPVWTKGSQPNGTVKSAEALTAGRFAVDYETGVLRLGALLAATDVLTVEYEPVVKQSQDVPDGKHYALAPPSWETPDNPHGELSVGAKGREIQYEVNWTIGDWFKENMRARPAGRWLVCQTGECGLQFDASRNPKAPLDPRFSAVRAQFFAAASYGPLQLTLGEWETPSKKDLLDQVLNVEAEPLYRVNRPSEWARGVALGAVVHRANLGHALATLALPTDLNNPCAGCDNERWQAFWATVMSWYNPAKSEYSIVGSLNSIVRRGRTYGPF